MEKRNKSELRNFQDLNEIPEKIKESINFLPVSSLEEVLQAAFPGIKLYYE